MYRYSRIYTEEARSSRFERGPFVREKRFPLTKRVFEFWFRSLNSNSNAKVQCIAAIRWSRAMCDITPSNSLFFSRQQLWPFLAVRIYIYTCISISQRSHWWVERGLNISFLGTLSTFKADYHFLNTGTYHFSPSWHIGASNQKRALNFLRQ